jgi:hypothetical protein
MLVQFLLRSDFCTTFKQILSHKRCVVGADAHAEQA